MPFELVSMNTVGLLQTTMTFASSSNGLASGNHILEAIEHGLCEVIERDAHALDWARGVTRSLQAKVDVETIVEPSLKALLAACSAADVDVAIFEMDSDIDVPTFRVGLVDRQDVASWRRLGMQLGCGTHLSPVVALSRAITEAAQARLTVIAGSRDDNPPAAYAASQEVRATQSFRSMEFAAPAARPFRTATQLQETETFEDDLEVLLQAIRSVGAERVIVVDLTKPHMGIPVVKVVVPGLEGPPFSPRYVEGTRARRAREEQP